MPFGKIYLDSNVLISTFGREDNREAAARMLTIIGLADADGPPAFVASELCLAEMLVRPFREQNIQDIRGFNALLVSRRWLTVEPVSRDVLWGSALLRSQYPHLKLPDAIHVATALLADCTHFLSADRKIRERYGNLQIDDDVWPGRATVEIIRPTLETLDAILAWVRA